VPVRSAFAHQVAFLKLPSGGQEHGGEKESEPRLRDVSAPVSDAPVDSGRSRWMLIGPLRKEGVWERDLSNPPGGAECQQ
jgi:hypothetical protein